MEYYYIKNDGKYINELEYVIMSKTNVVITSHLSEETAKIHVERINKCYPNGIKKRYGAKLHQVGSSR